MQALPTSVFLPHITNHSFTYCPGSYPTLLLVSQELEDLCKFNIAADEIYATEGLTLDEDDVKAEVETRKQQYTVRT